MKRLVVLIIVQAAVAACSVYRTRERTQEAHMRYAENRDTTAEASQQQQSRWELMQRWRYDSLGFGMLIDAQGGYRLHPDSGLTGESAWIWLNGQRRLTQAMRYETTSDSAVSQTRTRQSTAMAAQREERTERIVQNRRWISWSVWGMLIVGILVFVGFWWFRKKIR